MTLSSPLPTSVRAFFFAIRSSALSLFPHRVAPNCAYLSTPRALISCSRFCLQTSPQLHQENPWKYGRLKIARKKNVENLDKKLSDKDGLVWLCLQEVVFFIFSSFVCHIPCGGRGHDSLVVMCFFFSFSSFGFGSSSSFFLFFLLFPFLSLPFSIIIQ